ncbi:MAG: hypothetical protein AAB243_05165, partial [Planctomycetota bacterium]
MRWRKSSFPPVCLYQWVRIRREPQISQIAQIKKWGCRRLNAEGTRLHPLATRAIINPFIPKTRIFTNYYWVTAETTTGTL